MKSVFFSMAVLTGFLCAGPLFAQAPEGQWKNVPGLYALINTSKGTIVCQLFEKETPKTVENFVGLAEGTKPWLDPRTLKQVKQRFYDGLIFHRVIPDFMIQGGCPVGNGTGGPGYRFADEIAPNVVFDRPGKLAMANAGPGTNGSQFFITENATPWLNGRHTIFGQVVEGQEVVNAIARVERGAQDKPVNDVVINKIEIERVKDIKKEGALSGKKILFVVAPANFRDEEYIEPKQILTDAGAEVITASLTMGELTGIAGTKVKSDILLGDVRTAAYDAVVFIGGAGANVYWNNMVAHKIAKDTVKQKKVLGAICLAPATLAKAGVLKNKKATSFASVEKDLKEAGADFTGKPYEIDGKIITASGPEASKDFGTAILRTMIDK